MSKIKLLIIASAISALTSFSALAGEWKTTDEGWWYDNGDSTYASSGWSWIDGKCYYFDAAGYCQMDTMTPDGFQVDNTGAWVVDGVVQAETEAAADESPGALRFTRPSDYRYYDKYENTTTYTKNESSLFVFDIDYVAAADQQSKENGKEMQINLNEAMKGKCGVAVSTTTVQLNSGEWTRYEYGYRPFSDRTYITKNNVTAKVAYGRLYEGHWHMVAFGGEIDGIDTDAMMNACVE